MKAAIKLNQVIFPDLMSELIELSIDCLLQCNGNGYNILPGTWHHSCNGICYVNMQGALLAKYVGVDKNADYNSMNMPRGCRKIVALADLTDGDVQIALDYGDFDYTDEQLKAAVAGWSTDLEPSLDDPNWITAWRIYASHLKSVGL